MGLLKTFEELEKAKYKSKKMVGGKWVYDYGNGKEKVSKEEHIKGLKSWVEIYKTQRKAGNVKGAIQTRDNIDKGIKKLGLNREEIYGSDPDRPVKKSLTGIMIEELLKAKKATATQKRKVEHVMESFKAGELNVGGSPKKVTSREQAIAIAMSESGLAKNKKKKKKKLTIGA